MLNLPHESELSWGGPTVGELAAQLYPDLTYDTALPQQWVDLCIDRGFDPRSRVIWGYPNGWGKPYPLTAEAALGLAHLTIGLR